MLLPDSVKVEGARVTATVQNTQNANGTFSLVLTAYGDTLRLFIDEAPEKGRWQVPDVLLPGLEQREQVGGARAGRGWLGALRLLDRCCLQAVRYVSAGALGS